MKNTSKPQRPKAAAVATPLHPANPHQQGYDMAALADTLPALKPFLLQTPAGKLSINFADPKAVKTLNQALLAHHYGLQHWDLPEGYLCPPVPGRLDYLLYLADLLQQSHQGKKPKFSKMKLLDVGCGANLIYPLLAVKTLGCQVLGSDINESALAHAQSLIDAHQLGQKIELRQQKSDQHIFDHLLKPGEYLDATLCNPPFHQSAEEASAGSERKRQNLGLAKDAAALNFAGQAHELWCEGGELAFIKRMIEQSKAVAAQVFWFSCLVSKQQHVAVLQAELQKAGVAEQQLVEMAQGNKQSRFIAWTFLTETQQQLWRQHRWR